MKLAVQYLKLGKKQTEPRVTFGMRGNRHTGGQQAGHHSRAVAVWDLETKISMEMEMDKHFDSILLAPDGVHTIVGMQDGRVAIMDEKKSAPVKQWQVVLGHFFRKFDLQQSCPDFNFLSLC